MTRLLLLLSLCSALALSAQTTLVVTNEVHDATVNYGGVETGVANAYAFSTPSGYPISSYKAGVQWCFIASHTNTAASTLNIDAIGATMIKKFASGAETDVAAGDIAANQPECVIYNSTTSHWDLSSISAATGGGGVLPQRVLYTSTFLSGTQANITCGMPGVSACISGDYGTDQAATINAQLSGGNVILIVDGKYSLSTSLVIYSNTEIHVMPGCGFLMRVGSNAELAVNAHQNSPTTAGPASDFLVSNIGDQHIKISGGIWNANSTNAVTASADHRSRADGNWLYGLYFLAVDDLDVGNIQTWDSPTYCIIVSNASNVRVHDSWFHEPSTAVGKNTDGVHTDGPTDSLWILRNSFATGDDSIAINGDENRPLTAGVRGVKWGPQTNTYIEDNDFAGSWSGIRLCSVQSLVDNVFIRNTSGTTRSSSLILDNLGETGDGNYGNIDVDGWHVEGTATGDLGSGYWYMINANVQSLSVSNFFSTNPFPATLAPFRFVGSGTMQHFNLNNIVVHNPSGNALPGIVNTDAHINNIAVGNVIWQDHGSGTFFFGSNTPGNISGPSSYQSTQNMYPASGFTPGVNNSYGLPGGNQVYIANNAYDQLQLHTNNAGNGADLELSNDVNKFFSVGLGGSTSAFGNGVFYIFDNQNSTPRLMMDPVSGNVSIGGSISNANTMAGAALKIPPSGVIGATVFHSTGATPTVTINAGAGSGAGSSFIGGTMVNGFVSITTGTSPLAGVGTTATSMFTLTFPVNFGSNNVHCTFTPTSVGSAPPTNIFTVFVSNGTGTTSEVSLSGTPAASTVYGFQYSCGG